MKNELEKAIEKFKESPTSLEAYQAISDFVKIVLEHKEFMEQIEKEGETMRLEKIKLNADKGWNRGLSGKELKEHNKWRDIRSRALHDLDPSFPLHNLCVVHEWMKPENLTRVCDLLFKKRSSDDPLPEDDKKEFQLYLGKVFKKILPFLKEEITEVESLKVKVYDEQKRILHIGNYQIPIAKNEGNNNAHEIMAYIFVDNKDKLKDKFFYSDIADARFKADYNARNKDAHQPYIGAAKRINQIILIETKGRIADFLKPNFSTLGHIEVNPKYL